MIQATAPTTNPLAEIEAIKLPEDFMVFDIETGPLPDEQLARMCPPCKAKPHPGKFDPNSVKFGNLKDEAKMKAKMDEARAKHELAIESYEADVLQSKADHFAEFREKAALSATTGRVVAIGMADPTEIYIHGQAEELHALRRFWSDIRTYLDCNMPMVGFNIKNFDLPFLIQRSWIHGVPVPSGVRQGRFWNDLFIDLMEVWCHCRGFVSLDTLCASFGLPGKVTEVDGVEVSGATFHELWTSNRKVAERYLEADLLLPTELARRMQVV